VGGRADDERAKKIKIPTSSACVKGIAEGTITWEEDPDFGYEIASSVPGIDDKELLQPRLMYEAQGRIKEYEDFVDRFKTERVEFLEAFPGLEPEIIKAVG
jgi:phosphoenolpyruvate carboxykinase (ATP)